MHTLREGEPGFVRYLMLIPFLTKRLPLFLKYFYVNVEKEGGNVEIGKCENVEMRGLRRWERRHREEGMTEK
jgi:hypothetical protein